MRQDEYRRVLSTVVPVHQGATVIYQAKHAIRPVLLNGFEHIVYCFLKEFLTDSTFP